MSKILQLKIYLQGSKPKIWRRFLIEDSITFNELHDIIQTVMGWENYHLFEFEINDLRIIPPDEGFLKENELDPDKTKVYEFLNTEKQKFNYLYDFGDDWNHIIVVEKILEKDSSKKYPVCIAGKMSCPPEDCGGLWGYEEILEIQQNKNHPDYEERIIDWLGEDFNPEDFNIEEVNKKC